MEDIKINSEEEFKKAVDNLWRFNSMPLRYCHDKYEMLKRLAKAIHEYEEQNYPM